LNRPFSPAFAATRKRLFEHNDSVVVVTHKETWTLGPLGENAAVAAPPQVAPALKNAVTAASAFIVNPMVTTASAANRLMVLESFMGFLVNR